MYHSLKLRTSKTMDYLCECIICQSTKMIQALTSEKSAKVQHLGYGTTRLKDFLQSYGSLGSHNFLLECAKPSGPHNLC